MKKRIIAGLTLFSLLFLASAVYTIATIERATTTMDELIRLHQVEILREHLLIQLKRSQSDLYLKNTPYARSIDTVVTHVQAIDEIIGSCFGCHHAPPLTGRLNALRSRIEQYKSALSRAFTVRANAVRLHREEDRAYRLGAGLIGEADAITKLANARLKERTREASREIGRTKRMLYVLVILVPLAALVMTVVFIRGVTGPVHALLQATRRLKSGDLEYRIEGLRDEFGEVANSFNEMAEALREDRRRMQWAEQLLVLGEMAGGLAHEIKNPLAGIKASMEMLSCDRSLSPENRMVAHKSSEQIKRIDGMIKSVLNFARPPKPQLSLTDVNSLLDATIGLAERHPALARREPEQLVVLKDFDPELPETMADPQQLQQVFLNLLLNAADAMPDEGTITVRSIYSRPGRTLSVSIADTGRGIETAMLERIFNPFVTTKPNGTGLGLSISKGLIEQHGGSISARNNIDRGAVFTVTLPIRSA